MAKLMRVVDNVNMCCRHKGFIKILNELGVKWEKVELGEVFIFLNRNKTGLGLLTNTGDGTLGFCGFYKTKGEALSVEVVNQIALAMGNIRGIEMRRSILSALESVLRDVEAPRSKAA